MYNPEKIFKKSILIKCKKSGFQMWGPYISHYTNYRPSPQHYNITPSQTEDDYPPTTHARGRRGSRAATARP